MLNPTDFVRTLRWADAGTARFVSLPDLARAFPALARYPAPLKILVEAALRRFDGEKITGDHLARLLQWHQGVRGEVPFFVGRVLMQDASGIPLLGDLAALRAQAVRLGRDASVIEPEIPVDLVIDHSVIADRYGDAAALRDNLQEEFRQNRERYAFVKWAQQAFAGVGVTPPGAGIVHQVNLERLATGLVQRDGWAFPDTLVGTDSHTTMVNGLGVLGWGVGGLEAEAVLLGEPLYFDSPEVVGVALHGALRPGITGTDLALTLTRLLREHGVVGKLLDFHGPGARGLAVPDRATVANMAPEYGATAAWFGIDEATLDYYRLTGRDGAAIARLRRYYEAQALFGIASVGAADYSETIDVDLGQVRRVVSGPARPQQVIALRAVPASLPGPARTAGADGDGLADGDIVLAAITSCTNTANPAGMIAAGLLAQAAARRGLRVAPHVKTVLAPGSRAVTAYLHAAGLLDALQALGFHVSAYGCAACVGNSGALATGVEEAIARRGLSVAAVLSGNRNFEGRIHKSIKANYLASPALVIAYALAGSMRNLEAEPCGHDSEGRPVFLADIWPDDARVAAVAGAVVRAEAFADARAHGDSGAALWGAVAGACGSTFAWDPASSYFVEPPFFRPRAQAESAAPLGDARVLAVLGDSVTTDHISPVGAIAGDSDAARYLGELGIPPADFNTYGARRCNHHVMVRGTFGSPRLANALVAPRQGPLTLSARDGRECSIHAAAMENVDDGAASVILAGTLYGAGSARDWAAKGTALLGVRAVVAQGFERIHRSNLVMMGVLPVEIAADAAPPWEGLAWTGRERLDIEFDPAIALRGQALVRIRRDGAEPLVVAGRLRIDTESERRYLLSGGVLPFLARCRLGQ